MRTANSLENILTLGKIEGKRRRGQQRMRWLDSITDSMDMNLSKLREILQNRGAWWSAVHGVANNQTKQLLNNNYHWEMKDAINDRTFLKVFLFIIRLRNLLDYYPSWGHIKNDENVLQLVQMSNFSKGTELILYFPHTWTDCFY